MAFAAQSTRQRRGIFRPTGPSGDISCHNRIIPLERVLICQTDAVLVTGKTEGPSSKKYQPVHKLLRLTPLNNCSAEYWSLADFRQVGAIKVSRSLNLISHRLSGNFSFARA